MFSFTCTSSSIFYINVFYFFFRILLVIILIIFFLFSAYFLEREARRFCRKMLFLRLVSIYLTMCSLRILCLWSPDKDGYFCKVSGFSGKSDSDELNSESVFQDDSELNISSFWDFLTNVYFSRTVRVDLLKYLKGATKSSLLVSLETIFSYEAWCAGPSCISYSLS